ncbi:MAG: hypothetical protein O2967_10825 [Proteobacteria bacterium]|nr:hypothetical protein [Pseudomonadota bacterium]
MSKQQMAKPIDCKDAQQDIAALQGEKASVMKQIGAGARFVIPVAAVVNLWQEGSGHGVMVEDRKEVASGEYNKAIDKKIAEIKTACKL